MKKVFCLLLVLLTVSLPLFALAANDSRVVDQAGIFTADEVKQLEKKITAFREKYNMDMVILTNSKKHNKTVQAYADDYYDQNGYGVGSDKRGFLLFYDLYKSDFHITTTGQAIDILTDARLSDFGERFIPELRKAKNGKTGYASAFEKGIDILASYVEKGVPAGHTRVAQRSEYVQPTKRLTLMEIVISCVIAIGVGLAISFGTISSYKLKGNTYSYAYPDHSKVNLTHSEDTFLTTTHHRVRVPKDPPSSSHGGGSSSTRSSVHISSGGRSHGGGSFHV